MAPFPIQARGVPSHLAPPGFRISDTGQHVTGAASFIFPVVADGERGAPHALFVCKRLSPRARADHEAARGMREEGALLAALGGRGAPQLIGKGDDAHGPFVVMERIAWPTLRAHLEAGVCGTDWIARASSAAFSRLAEVHVAGDAAGTLGVVHADLSPDNVAFAEDATDATLLDFGLARWRDAAPRDTSAFRGTLVYAAPELARGEPIDVRADLFALAASLLHAASGVSPRVAPNAASLLAEAAEAPLDAWAAAAARPFPEPLRAALRGCLAFDRALRPASAAAVADSC